MQVACSKYSKPLIDAGVGIHDGTIRVWLPETNYSCIGCHAYGIKSAPSRTVYSSDPAIAEQIAPIITEICKKIVKGEKVDNRIDIDLKDFSVKRYNWERNDDCPFCSTKVKFKINIKDDSELIIKRDREETIYEFEKYLQGLLGENTRINYVYKDESFSIPKEANLILLKVLERQGLKLYITKTH